MPKAVTIKITKAFEIKPNTRYLVILPKYAVTNPDVYSQLLKLFEGSEFVGLAINKPSDVKLFEIREDKNATGKNKSSS